MKKALLTILATACIFSAGVFAGIWIQRTQPVPAPPTGLLGEIREVPLSGTVASAKIPNENLPQLKAEIERMKPDIEAFKQKLEPIKNEFRDQLDALLTPDQIEKRKAMSERGVLPSSSVSSDDAKNTHAHRSRDGLDSVFPIVIVPITLERLTAELELTPDQRTAVQALLMKRRAKFLELVDTSPPPSLKLSRIAPLVPQIAKPPAK